MEEGTRRDLVLVDQAWLGKEGCLPNLPRLSIPDQIHPAIIWPIDTKFKKGYILRAVGSVNMLRACHDDLLQNLFFHALLLTWLQHHLLCTFLPNPIVGFQFSQAHDLVLLGLDGKIPSQTLPDPFVF